MIAVTNPCGMPWGRRPTAPVSGRTSNARMSLIRQAAVSPGLGAIRTQASVRSACGSSGDFDARGGRGPGSRSPGCDAVGGVDTARTALPHPIRQAIGLVVFRLHSSAPSVGPRQAMAPDVSAGRNPGPSHPWLSCRHHRTSSPRHGPFSRLPTRTPTSSRRVGYRGIRALGRRFASIHPTMDWRSPRCMIPCRFSPMPTTRGIRSRLPSLG